MRKKILSCGMGLLLLLGCGLSAAAEQPYDGIMQSDYRGGIKPIPKTYTYQQSVSYLGEEYGSLNEASDLFVAPNDHIFIADTNNNRVVELDEELNTVAVYTNEAEEGFQKPQGVFVDEDGQIYVADTDNRRIVLLDEDGTFVEAYGKPVSTMLSEEFTFTPRRLAVSSTGYMYVIRHQWLMQIDGNNEFRGYVGVNEVGYDFFYVVRRFFANEKQKIAMSRREPDSCLSFDIAPDGSIYVTSAGESDQLKRINSVGVNTYPAFECIQPTDADGQPVTPNLIDVAAAENGLVYLLESRSAQIMIYDDSGNNLAIFGGLGDGRDTLTVGECSGVTLEDVNSEGVVYVLDQGQNSVKVYEPTEFLQNIASAVSYMSDGRYSQALEYWNRVADVDYSYRLANYGIGKSYYKNHDWQNAMYYYEMCDNKSEYSAAFSERRQEIIHAYFGWFVLAAFGALALLILLVRGYLWFAGKTIRKYYDRI